MSSSAVRARHIISNLAAVLISTLFSLAICEMGLRVFLPQNLIILYRTQDDLTIHRPNHSGIFRGIETVQQYTMNALGMRDRHHEVEERQGVFRILLLGDSFMEALQVPFEKSLPNLLEKKLRDSTGRGIEVINAGVSGWGTDEELTYLVRYGVRFKPDLIMVGMTLHNDLFDNLENHFHALAGDRLVERPMRNASYTAYKFWQLKAFLGAHSHLYQLLRTWWHSEETDNEGRALSSQVADLIRKEPSIQLRESWKLTMALLKEIKRVSAEYDTQPVIFLIPLAIQIYDTKLSRFLSEHHLDRETILLDGPQQVMKTFGEREQIEVIDLLPGFKEWVMRHREPLYFRQDGHWTEQGHELAADLVARVLTQKQIVKLN